MDTDQTGQCAGKEVSSSSFEYTYYLAQLTRRNRCLNTSHYPVVGLGIAMALMLSPRYRRMNGRWLTVRLTIGWGDEPAFTGSKNFVSVAVADAAGMPVVDPEGSLAVEVSFGDQRIMLPLRPAFQRPGEFRAPLVPTRSGTYAFHITGTLKGQTIDTTSTCSDQTFDCVADVSEMQFPVRDPSAGQLAESVNRALPRADRAVDTAAGAQRMAMAAIAVAVLALAVAIGLVVRGSRKVA